MTKSIPQRAEVVVVGAGVIGLAVADALARRGRQVLVLERERVGAGATWAAGGMIGPASEVRDEEQVLVDLAIDSRDRFPDWVREIEAASGVRCGLRMEGTLLVALGRDHEEDLDQLARAQRARNIETRRLTADEVFDLEPHLSGWVTGGLLAKDDFQVDPRLLVRSLAGAAEALGGTVVEGAEVADVGAHRVCGTYGGKRFEVACDVAVLAAGAWSTTGIASALGETRVRPVKGQMVRLRGPELVRHVVRTPEVYIIPRGDGEVLLGATVEEMGFDPHPTAGAAMDLLRRAWHAVPGIYDLAFEEVSVGFRPATESHLPVIGRLDDGTYVATGHYRHGVMLAASTGELLADLIVDGEESELIKPFRPGAA